LKIKIEFSGFSENNKKLRDQNWWKIVVPLNGKRFLFIQVLNIQDVMVQIRFLSD